MSIIKTYRVGGFVRDKLLTLDPHDCDYVVVGSTIQEMLSKGFIPVGKSFPVFLHPVTHEEYALARTEKKIAVGHQGFAFNTSPNVTLNEDLSRRDLTINAIAQNTNTNELIDPFNGIKDLQNKLLKHISPAFAEDPLRVLRVARFAARFNFNVAPPTINLMSQISLSGELKTISIERITEEFYKALSCEYSFNFIQVLADCDALIHLFPEINFLYLQKQHDLIKILNQAQNFNQRYLGIILLLSLNNQQASISNLRIPNKLIELTNLFLAINEYLFYDFTNEQLLKLIQKIDYKRNQIRYDELMSITNNYNSLFFNDKFFIKLEKLQLLCLKIAGLPIKTIIANLQANEIKSTIKSIQLTIIEQEIN